MADYYVEKAAKKRKDKEKESMKKAGVGEHRGEDMVTGERGSKKTEEKDLASEMRKKILKKMKGD